MGGGIQRVSDIFYVVALLVKISSRVCSWEWVAGGELYIDIGSGKETDEFRGIKDRYIIYNSVEINKNDDRKHTGKEVVIML